MTNAEFVSAVAAASGMKKADVKLVLEIIGDVAVDVLRRSKAGDSVPIVPGYLKVRKHRRPPAKARMGRNPATGESIRIPAKKAALVLKTRVLKGLKEAL